MPISVEGSNLGLLGERVRAGAGTSAGLSTVFCQLVEAQFGPGRQEMGGFWSRAAVALAKEGLNACGWALDAGHGCRSAREKAKPTGWQDWQAEQASQSA